MQKSVHSPQQHVLQQLLKRLRLSAGLRQADLAERLDVQRTFISRVESGEVMKLTFSTAMQHIRRSVSAWSGRWTGYSIENMIKRPASKFISVAEDIEWLHNEWWHGPRTGPTDDTLRRGSTTLRLLLIDNAAQNAWRYYGFTGQPSVPGPDLLTLMARDGIKPEHVIALVAGGGRIDGIDTAMFGAARADNPTTGRAAMDGDGFRVVACSVIRDAERATPGVLDQLVERAYPVAQYLEAPAAILFGDIFKRREIIQYFANYAGGAHLEKPRAKSLRPAFQVHKRIGELEGRLHAIAKDGLHFELQSIGQAVGRSPDMLALAARIRADVS